MATDEQIKNFEWDDLTTWIDLGNDHFMRYFDHADGTVNVGISEAHLNPDGDWCVGAIPFDTQTPTPQMWTDDGWKDAPTWHVDQEDPLTISPSVACETCPAHGYIKDGAWEDV